MRKGLRLLCLAVVVCAAAVLGAACGSSQNAQSGPAVTVYHNAVVAGTVATDHPVAGANVVFYGLDGRPLSDQPQGIRTQDTGAFIAQLPTLPSNFRVVATGGTTGGQIFDGSLGARYTGFNPTSNTIQIGPVSNLIDTYSGRANASLPASTQAVARFLELPAAAQAATLTFYPQQWFDPAAFMQAANAGGGVDSFSNQLAQQIQQNQNARRPFPASTANAAVGGGPADLAAYIGGQLVNGAISYVGGQGIGWVLDKLDLIRSNASQFAAIQGQLTQIIQQLTAIQAKLETLQYLELRGQVLGDYRELTKWVSQVQNIHKNILTLSQIDPAKPSPECAKAPDPKACMNAYIDGKKKAYTTVDIPKVDGVDAAGADFPFRTYFFNVFFTRAGLPPMISLIYETARQAAVAKQAGFYTPNIDYETNLLVSYFALAYTTNFELVLERKHYEGAPVNEIDDTVAAYQQFENYLNPANGLTHCTLPQNTTVGPIGSNGALPNTLMWYTRPIYGEVPGPVFLNTAGNKGPGAPLPSAPPPNLPPGTPWPPSANRGCTDPGAQTFANWRVATSDQLGSALAGKTGSDSQWLNGTRGFDGVGDGGRTMLMTATHGPECRPCYVADWPYPTESYNTRNTQANNWTWCMPNWVDFGDDHKRLISKGWLGCFYSPVSWLATRPLGASEKYF